MGKDDERPDGTYVASVYFTVGIPLFAVGRYRVSDAPRELLSHGSWYFHERLELTPHQTSWRTTVLVFAAVVAAAALVGSTLIRKVNPFTVALTRDTGPSLPDGVRRNELNGQPFLFAPAAFRDDGPTFTIAADERLGSARFRFTGLSEAMARGEGEGNGDFAVTDGARMVAMLAQAFRLEVPPDAFPQRSHAKEVAPFRWKVAEHTGNWVVGVSFEGAPALQVYVNVHSPELAIGEPCAGDVRFETVRCEPPPASPGEAARLRATALAEWALVLRDGVPGRLLAAKDPSLIRDAPLWEHAEGTEMSFRVRTLPSDALATSLPPPEGVLPQAAALKAPGTCTLEYVPATRTLSVDGTPLVAIHAFLLEQLHEVVHGDRAALWLGPCHLVLHDWTASSAPFVLNLKTGKGQYLFPDAADTIEQVSSDFRTAVVGEKTVAIPPLP